MTTPEMPDPHRPSHDVQQYSVWRVIRWGVTATAALAAAVFVSQSETGSQRLELAVLGTGEPAVAAAQIPAPVPASAPADDQTEKLAAEVRALTADRDRLVARLASLERNLEDMTGSINRPSAAPATAAVQAPDEEPTPPPIMSAPVSISAPLPPAGAPTMLPRIAEIAPLAGETPRIIEPFAMLSGAAREADWPQASSEKLSVDKESRHVLVPLPPRRDVQRMAALPAAERPSAAPRPDTAAPRIEIGVDIGGSLSPGGLASQWTAVKANFGPMLTGLRPAIGRDQRFGHAPFRLLVGPLPNPAAAQRLCARLAAAGVECRPARFEGQQLAQF